MSRLPLNNLLDLEFDPATCYISLPKLPYPLTVSRLNQTVRLLLEQEMGQVWISGDF